jgi:protease secretion system membrane fusion protein
METPTATVATKHPEVLETLGKPFAASLYGLVSVIAGITFLLVWAAFAPIDEGVPTQGLVVLDTKRKPIQHLQGGIVKEVVVREGDFVQQGQVLLVLEGAVAKANLESVRQHYHALRAAESRLLAEQNHLPSIAWHPDLTRAAVDPNVTQHQLIQEQLFRTRRASLQASISGLNETLAGQEAMYNGGQRMLKERKTQLILLNEELAGLEGLVNEGFMPRNKEWELKRSRADVTAIIADIESNSQRLLRSNEEIKQRIKVAFLENQKEVENQLADIRREIQADGEKLTAVTQDMERTDIRSPASGQVVGLSVQTVGAVISPGQHLMDIVPQGDPLIIEARIPPTLIDRVNAGLIADIRFSSFSHSPQLVVQGRVMSISGDLLSDTETHQPYFLARIEITEKGKKDLGLRVVRPGMAAEVVIRTGERSLLTYITYPLVRRMAQAMKEE